MLTVVFLAACGSLDRADAPQKTELSTPGKSTEQTGIAAGFVGTEWNLISLHGHGLIEGTDITLEIDRGGER